MPNPEEMLRSLENPEVRQRLNAMMDDPAFLDMLNTLERVFRENYTYTTEIWPIPDQT